jgi:hypothetical protein
MVIKQFRLTANNSTFLWVLIFEFLSCWTHLKKIASLRTVLEGKVGAICTINNTFSEQIQLKIITWIGPLQLEVMLGSRGTMWQKNQLWWQNDWHNKKEHLKVSIYAEFERFLTYKRKGIFFFENVKFYKECIAGKHGLSTNFKVLFLIMSIILSSELIFCHNVPRDPHVTSSCKGPITYNSI